MSCGDKYQHLLVTETGRTPDDPCWLDSPWCIIGESDAWHNVADRVAAQVKLRIGLLGGKDAALSPELNERIAEYRKAYGKLSSSGFIDLLSPDAVLIDENIANAREGTCVMELLDERLEAANVPIPEAPTPEVAPDKPSFGTRLLVGSLAIVGVVGVGAFTWWAITRDENEAAA